MTTMIQLPIEAETVRRVRRQAIGRVPARSEHIDFKTPCRKCGNAPTWMVKRGPVVIERTCHTCGDVEFFDMEAAVHNSGSQHRSEEDHAITIPVGVELAA